MLHHELSGSAEGPVLMLGNSLGTTLSMWDGVVASLGDSYRLLRFDHRGHGGSPVPLGPYTMEELGLDALALLDSLDVDRVFYCGLSLGGMVGMWLAAYAPSRIDRLALVCTSAWLPPAEGWLDRAARVRAGGMAAVADLVLARWFSAAARPEDVARSREMLLSIPPEGYARCCEAIATLDLRAELPSITAETLVISGGNDLAIPPSHGEAIAKAVPGAQFVVLPQPAHLAAVEEPAAIAGLVKEFLDD